MADGPVALDGVEALLVEHVVHEAHALVGAQPSRRRRAHDARRLLAPVLLGVEAEVGEVGGLGMAEDPEEGAAIVEIGRRRGRPGGEPTRARLGEDIGKTDVSRSSDGFSSILAEELADPFLGRLRGQGSAEAAEQVDLGRGRGARDPEGEGAEAVVPLLEGGAGGVAGDPGQEVRERARVMS